MYYVPPADDESWKEWQQHLWTHTAWTPEDCMIVYIGKLYVCLSYTSLQVIPHVL